MRRSKGERDSIVPIRSRRRDIVEENLTFRDDHWHGPSCRRCKLLLIDEEFVGYGAANVGIGGIGSGFFKRDEFYSLADQPRKQFSADIGLRGYGDRLR